MTDQTPHDGVPPENGQPPMPAGVPVGPTDPGAPVPSKKRLPGWAIALIIGGGLLLIGIIVVAIMVVSMFLNTRQIEDCSMPGSCGQGLPPTPTGEASISPTESDPSTDNIPLDGSAAFSNPPVWNTPFLSGWDINIFDQEGVNQFESKALGCLFTTSQNMQSVDASSPSDAAQSTQLMNDLTDSIVKEVPDAIVTGMRPAEVGLGISGSHTIEFATARVDYTTSLGDYVNVFLARSMPSSGSYMYALVSCPTATMDGAESPLEDLLDQISIVALP